MMKKLLLAVLIFSVTAGMVSAAPAALITQGSSEVGIGGMLDFSSAAGTDFDLNFQYSYFFWNAISIGGRVLIADNDFAKQYGVGVIGEYNFILPSKYKPLIGTAFVPFVGGTLDYRYAKAYGDSSNVLVFGAEGGAKFFMTESAAVVLALVGEVATDDIYPNDDELDSYDLRLELGLRLYF